MLRRTHPKRFSPLAALRSTATLLAPAIPRHTWDPERHDKKWVDSIAKPISDRRAWSAKKYRIGLEPLTPSEWLHYSLRNLAYEYNAAMRACETFPDLLPLYREMKQRGVKVDVDTMYVVLGRAARYEGIDPRDVFKLFDELVQLGAKPDIAVIEILHTLFDLSVGVVDPTWRELRRRDLIRWYHRLAAQDIQSYGQQGHDKLMLSQMRRYRQNLQSLGSVLHSALWVSMFAHVRESEDLVTELQALLWERAPKDAEYAELTAPGGNVVTVPMLGEHLRRFILSSSSSASSNKKDAAATGTTKQQAQDGDQQQQQDATTAKSDQDTIGSDEDTAAAALLLSLDPPTDAQQKQANAAVVAALGGSSSSSSSPTAWSIESDSAEELGEFLGDILLQQQLSHEESFSAVAQRRAHPTVKDFEDFALNRALLSALERLVDEPFPVNPNTQQHGAPEPLVALSLVAMAWRSGMLFSADVFAQALDIVRFVPDHRRRELDGIRYLRFALQGTSMRNRAGNPAVILWRNHRCALDDRVVARYVYCRDPWSDTVFCPAMSKQMFGSFASLLVSGGGGSNINANGANEGEQQQQQSNNQSNNKISSSASTTTHIIQERWNDLMQLFDRFTLWNRRVRSTGTPISRLELQQQQQAENVPDNHRRSWILDADTADGLVEVMGAASDFLLRLTLAAESGLAAQQQQQNNASAVSASGSASQLRALDELFRVLAQLKRDIDVTCSIAQISVAAAPAASSSSSSLEPLTPSVECWECLLTTCRVLMDRLVASRSTDLSVQRDADALFGQVAALRTQMVNESKDRFGGKMRMLWLQEA